MMSDDNFERLFRDPRLGFVPKFFQATPDLSRPIHEISDTKNVAARDQKQRCKNCSHCLMEDCGSCIQCMDKPKVGGK